MNRPTPPSSPRRPRVPFPAGSFLASALILLAAVGLYAVWEGRRVERELLRQTEEKAIALVEVLETFSKNAILGNSLLEDAIGHRLLDNARLIDLLLLRGTVTPGLLERLKSENHLQKIEFLDQAGTPVQPASSPAMVHQKMMGPMRESTEPGRPMAGPRPHEAPPQASRGPADAMARRHWQMMYMWGRWWTSRPEEREEGEVPPVVKERRFWKGSLFGVAIGARSFPGIITVHADANYILNFRKEIGLQRQLEELSRLSGIVSAAVYDRNLTLQAHTDPARVGQRESDPFLQQAWQERRLMTRKLTEAGRGPVFEVVRPVVLTGTPVGLLRIDLSLAPVHAIWTQDRRTMAVFALAVLLVGIMGFAAIFYSQQRHLVEIRKLEQEMAQKERLSLLGNMAASVAHEVRNPLNAISMGLQRLRAEFVPGGEAAEYSGLVDLMRGEVRRLNTIVEEFMTLARAPAPKLETVQVEEILQEVEALATAEIGPRPIGVVRKVHSPLPPIQADRAELKQALLNLVGNAIQAMPEGGTLTIEGGPTRNGVRLTVADTGVGIPAEALPRIFDPYFTTKTKGFGLGLAIVRRVVDAHGGQIEVQSEPGRGTRFEVTLSQAGPRA